MTEHQTPQADPVQAPAEKSQKSKKSKSISAKTSASMQNYRQQLQMVAGERLYTIARWVMFGIVLVMALLVVQVALWPLSFGAPFALVVWLYGLFCIGMTVVLFTPPLYSLFKPAYGGDILFVTLLTLLSGQPAFYFLPLYILPLSAVALRYGKTTGLVFGVGTAGAYIAASFGERILGDSEVLAFLSSAALGLQGIILAGYPWVIGKLDEHWSGEQGAGGGPALAVDTVAASADQVGTLFAVSSTLADTMKGEDVLDTLLREGQRLVPYHAGLALLPGEKPGELVIEAGHNLSLVDPGLAITVTQGSRISKALYPPATPQVIQDIGQEEDLQPITSLKSAKVTCLIPLRSGVKIYGLVFFIRTSNDTFTQEQISVLQSLMNVATAALLNRELMREVNKDHLDMAAAEEHARHWLAREIHDGLAQKLAAITMNTEFIKRLIDQDTEASKVEVDKLNETFKRANYDVRTLLGELKPTTLDAKGLPAALQEYIERIRVVNEQIEFVFEAKGVSGMTLANEAKGTLFNIVQESINNAIKYASPKHIWVRMAREGYRLEISVEDDGKGFDVEESKARAKARGSYGLSNLVDRAALINGVTQINSEPGKGSKITVHVPLEV